MRRSVPLLVALSLLFAIGCGPAETPPEEVQDAGEVITDAGQPVVDAGPVDSGQPVIDAGPVDSGSPVIDAGPVDSGLPVIDAGPVDPGSPVTDAGPVDSGSPFIDAGPVDSGSPFIDAGPVDSGSPFIDAGPVDSGSPVIDAGPEDAGQPEVDAGPEDAGQPEVDAGPEDAGQPEVDAGPVDAGQPEVDAGSEDAGQPEVDAGPADAGIAQFVLMDAADAGNLTVRIQTDLGNTDLSLAAAQLPGGSGLRTVRAGLWPVSVRNAAGTERALGSFSFRADTYSLVTIVREAGQGLPNVVFADLPNDNSVGSRHVVLIHDLHSTATNDGVALSIDHSGDDVADVVDVPFGNATRFDVPSSVDHLRMTIGGEWLDYPFTTGSGGFDDGATVVVVASGTRGSFETAGRAVIKTHTHFQDRATFTQQRLLPRPRLQIVNLRLIDASGTRRDLYANGTLVLSGAGFGAVSPAFSIPSGRNIDFSVANTGSSTAPASVGTQSLSPGMVGLIVYVEAYQLMRVIDSRSTGGGTVSALHNLVHANPLSPINNLYGGQLNGTLLNVYQPDVQITPNYSSANAAWPGSMSNVAVRDGNASNSSIWRSGVAVNNSGSRAFTFFSRLDSTGAVRFVRVSAGMDAYARYSLQYVSVPCRQTTSACTPCAGAACSCPRGVQGCPP